MILFDQETRQFSCIDETREFSMSDATKLALGLGAIGTAAVVRKKMKSDDRKDRINNRQMHKERMEMIRYGMDPSTAESENLKQTRMKYAHKETMTDKRLNSRESDKGRDHELNLIQANRYD